MCERQSVLDSGMESTVGRFCILALLATSALCQVTPQFKKTIRKVADECHQKHETNSLQVMNVIANGAKHVPSNCFLSCMFEKLGLMKNGKITTQTIKAKMKNVPDERTKAAIVNNADQCLQQDTKNVCEYAFNVIRCFYKALMTAMSQPPTN